MIEVLQPGTRTTLQDAGRPGFRHKGMPHSGAADRLSFALANWMVGNDWNTPALECTLGGLHVRFHKDTTIALAGANMWAQINGQNIGNYTAIPVKSGDILTLSFAREGCRSYLAVSGGFKGDEFLGSQSTYLPDQIGGFGGIALQTKHSIPIEDNQAVIQKIPNGYKPSFSNHIVLRAHTGPEWDLLSAESQRHLFINPYLATSRTNRTGARLKGNVVHTNEEVSMISSPLIPGTLQTPPDGQPILAMIDGHCTGGYPRALQVIKADLWLMGQIKPGTKISFQRCMDDSGKILKHRTAFYRSIMDGFEF